MQVFWFIPTHGDSRYLGTAEGHAKSITPICSRWPWPPIRSATRAC